MVPVGTQVFAEDNQTLLHDLTKTGRALLSPRKAAKAGLGKRRHFKSSTNRAPRKSTNGKEGEDKTIWLRLKLIADVGIVGQAQRRQVRPSLRRSPARRARRSANYPFTHAQIRSSASLPSMTSSFVIADLPGLIEGRGMKASASANRFLGHAEALLRALPSRPTARLSPMDIAKSYAHGAQGDISAYGQGLDEKVRDHRSE